MRVFCGRTGCTNDPDGDSPLCLLHEMEEIPDSDFEWRWPVWMERRIAELKAEGKTAEEAAAILVKEVRGR